MFLNICKNTFHIFYVCISQKVKCALMWNLQHTIFIWRRRYLQIFKSALVYLWDPTELWFTLLRSNNEVNSGQNNLLTKLIAKLVCDLNLQDCTSLKYIVRYCINKIRNKSKNLHYGTSILKTITRLWFNKDFVKTLLCLIFMKFGNLSFA